MHTREGRELGGASGVKLRGSHDLLEYSLFFHLSLGGGNDSTCCQGMSWGLTRQAPHGEALKKAALVTSMIVTLTGSIPCIFLRLPFPLNSLSVIGVYLFYTEIGQFTWSPSPQSFDVRLI